jgi:hypothetical protein
VEEAKTASLIGRRASVPAGFVKEAAVPMSAESFQRRVALLRDSWAERRELKGLATVHDFDSQFRLLRTLHGWAEAAARDVAEVYGPELSVTLSPAPQRGANPAFTITVADQFTVTFLLGERRRTAASTWFITVMVGSGAPGGPIVAAGPERRTGQWTRTRLEDIVLSVLGAYERSSSEGGALRTRGA